MRVNPQTRSTDSLKDEVYRQMLRIEVGYPKAELLLGMALLRAWVVIEKRRADSEPKRWLLRTVPVSICLIHASEQKRAAAGNPNTLSARQHP